jgi:hypothetical protein
MEPRALLVANGLRSGRDSQRNDGLGRDAERCHLSGEAREIASTRAVAYLALDVGPSATTGSHSDARLRGDARGRDGGVCTKLAQGIGINPEIGNDLGHRRIVYLRLRGNDV